MVLVAKGSNKDFDFEKVEIDVWIQGVIEEVQARFDKEQQYQDKKTGEWETRKVDQCRFKFRLDNYGFAHYSRWMTLSTNENSTLYKKYITSLFGGKYPADSDLDIEALNGVPVKTMWDETPMKEKKGVFQFVSKIRLLNPEDADKIDLLIKETDTGEIDKFRKELGEE